MQFIPRGISDRFFLAPLDNAGGDGTTAPASPRRVLVIDDDIDHARSLSYLLATSGYKVEYAINGIAGLKIAQSFVPHVLILDLKLPDAHGAEMARQCRRDPTLKGLRIIAITGSKQRQDVERALAAGCDEVLTKPVAIATLEGLIGTAKGG
jgi:CheY-like chemotaxis protein